MSTRNASAKSLALVLGIILIFCSLSSAQTEWLDIRDFGRISITGSKVSLESGAPDLSFLSSVWFVSGNVPASDEVSIVFDVPVAYFDSDEQFLSIGNDAEIVIGNPYIGIEGGARKQGPYTMAGLRLPIAPGDKPNAELLGALTHFDRYEAFAPKLFSVSAGGGYRSEWPSGAGLFAEGGGTIWVPTEGGGNSEFLLNYKAGFRYRTGQAGFIWCFKGRVLLTESAPDFGDRLFHQIGFGADIRWGEVYPGLRITVPVTDNLSGAYNVVYGLNLTIKLGEDKGRDSSTGSEW